MARPLPDEKQGESFIMVSFPVMFLNGPGCPTVLHVDSRTIEDRYLMTYRGDSEVRRGVLLADQQPDSIPYPIELFGRRDGEFVFLIANCGRESIRPAEALEAIRASELEPVAASDLPTKGPGRLWQAMEEIMR